MNEKRTRRISAEIVILAYLRHTNNGKFKIIDKHSGLNSDLEEAGKKQIGIAPFRFWMQYFTEKTFEVKKLDKGFRQLTDKGINEREISTFKQIMVML